MSEENMKAAFSKWWEESGGGPVSLEVNARHTWKSAWQAALQQESEAGAVEEVAYKDAPAQIWLNLGDCTAEEIAANNAGWNGLAEVTWCESKMDQFDIPYVRADLAPQYAQAIETAAIIKCAEAAEEWRKSEDDRKLSAALLALIPQDGRTQLEEFGMRVASKAAGYGWSMGMEGADTMGTDLRSIVSSLIGAAK